MCLDACNIIFSQTCCRAMAHAHPPKALAQVSAGSTRRHTGRTRPTGVCGDHVGGPGTYARAQAAMALAAHASVRRATRVATLYSTRAGLWGQLTVAHGPHSAQLSVWRPCVLVWEPTPATDRTRITMSCQNDRRTQSFPLFVSCRCFETPCCKHVPKCQGSGRHTHVRLALTGGGAIMRRGRDALLCDRMRCVCHRDQKRWSSGYREKSKMFYFTLFPIHITK